MMADHRNLMPSTSGKVSTPINFFKEKLILQEEEKQLKKMLEKFQDQQNRLKIEELALISKMKMEKERVERGDSRNRSAASSRTMSSVTSSDAGSFAPVGIMSEDASVINQQSLDLKLESGGSFTQDHIDVEEEEEELDSEEEEIRRAQMSAADTSHQLMSFMEDF